jgi:DHA2 family multidrug resistance protein-like MFS transporter
VGRKRLLLIGVAAFGLSSLLAAFAATPETLIAARALLGVSGAAIMPSTLALIRNIFTDPKERTRAIAIWSAAFGGGSAIGPLVGGLLLEHFWWGSVFLVNVPVMLVMLVAGIVLLPESKNPTPGRFDVWSAVLSLATVTPLVYAIKHTVASGFDPVTAACLIGGLAAGYLFVRRQRRLENPLLDVELFRIPAFSGADCCSSSRSTYNSPAGTARSSPGSRRCRPPSPRSSSWRLSARSSRSSDAGGRYRWACSWLLPV